MENRRTFIKKSALVAGSVLTMSASSYKRILGANDRINLCFMGLGRRVGAYYPSLAAKYNTRLAYLCDVKQSQVYRALTKLNKLIDYKPEESNDIRKVLEDKEVDAVFVAPPDHWHAPATCMALEAGKHVYVEKPCAHNPREAEIMVAKQQKYGHQVQMGNQQRSSAHTIQVIKEIHEGLIGEPYRAIAFYNNSRGEVPRQERRDPPGDLNWDLFQGPAPRQDYFHNTWDYNWHWYGWKWGTAETGNNAVHELDIARWALQVDYPNYCHVNASKEHFKEDGWEMYDTMYATFKFDKGKQIIWDGRSRNGLSRFKTEGRGTIIHGTEGSVMITRSHHEVYDRAGNLIKESARTNEGGVALGGGGDTSTNHIANFFDAIRGKAVLNAPIADGAISNHMALLANIAYRSDEVLDVNPINGKIKGKVGKKYWSREYEPGWELKV